MGFASMGEEQQKELASKGGRAAHQSVNAHEFDSDEWSSRRGSGGNNR